MKHAVFEAIAHSRVGQTWEHVNPREGIYPRDLGAFVVLAVKSIDRSTGWRATYTTLQLDGWGSGFHAGDIGVTWEDSRRLWTWNPSTDDFPNGFMKLIY